MFILVSIAILDVVLLAATIWSTRRRPVRAHMFARRGEDIPHAL